MAAGILTRQCIQAYDPTTQRAHQSITPSYDDPQSRRTVPHMPALTQCHPKPHKQAIVDTGCHPDSWPIENASSYAERQFDSRIAAWRSIRPDIQQGSQSVDYVLDSDDSDVPLAQIRQQPRKTQSKSLHEHTAGEQEEAGRNDSSTSKALKRRKSWTPVKIDVKESSSRGFANLCKRFNYDDSVLSAAQPNVSHRRGQVGQQSADSKSKNALLDTDLSAGTKLKKPAKKAKTITALATAAYSTVSSVSTTLPVPSAERVKPCKRSTDTTREMPPPEKKPRRKASAASVNGQRVARERPRNKQTRAARPKQVERVYEPLLPPSQAQSKLSHQAFVFGTSSQLQLEESPKQLRHGPDVIVENDELPSSPLLLTSPERASNAFVPMAPHGTTISTASTPRNLWRASARNGTHGTYHEVTQHSRHNLADSVIDASAEPVVLNLSSDRASSPPSGESTDVNTLTAISTNTETRSSNLPPHTSRAILQALDANQGVTSESPRHHKAQLLSRTPTIVSLAATTTPRPKQRLPNSEPRLESVRCLSTSPRSSPPSKWYCVDEIMDSETSAPSPTRKKASSPLAQLELTADGGRAVDERHWPAQNTHMDDPSWATVLPDLFTKITSTVRGVPRSDSLTNPTWHEKMLLYDPIVIEDLTAWLNEQGVRVRVRNKASRKKSSNNDADQLPAAPEEATDQELSHWMVQKWCREHSICCLWKEGLRGGVRTKY